MQKVIQAIQEQIANLKRRIDRLDKIPRGNSIPGLTYEGPNEFGNTTTTLNTVPAEGSSVAETIISAQYTTNTFDSGARVTLAVYNELGEERAQISLRASTGQDFIVFRVYNPITDSYDPSMSFNYTSNVISVQTQFTKDAYFGEDVYITVGADYRKIEIGDPDSAGTGYRMLRVLN